MKQLHQTEKIRMCPDVDVPRIDDDKLFSASVQSTRKSTRGCGSLVRAWRRYHRCNTLAKCDVPIIGANLRLSCKSSYRGWKRMSNTWARTTRFGEFGQPDPKWERLTTAGWSRELPALDGIEEFFATQSCKKPPTSSQGLPTTVCDDVALHACDGARIFD